MKYQQEEITLPGTMWNRGEETIVSAQIAEGTGLCYHANGGDKSYGWTITHLASKKALCAPIGTEHEVMLLLERVVGITDWHQDEKILIKHPEHAIKFKECQQTIRQELNMQLETAMRQCMPDWLIEDVLNQLEDIEYPILRNALLYAFKIVD